MFHDLIAFLAWPLTALVASYRNDFPWSLVVMIVLLTLIRVGRRGGKGRDEWRKRGEEMRERAERREAEIKAYHEQVLVELRQQNDLLRKLLAERGINVETPAAADTTPNLFAEPAATETEPASEI